MNTDRVKVFHTAHGNDVAHGVTHSFKLDFFPAVDIFFNKNLRNRGSVKSRSCDDSQFLFVFGDTAAGSA